ncbi:ATP-binding protein [Streptomyces sp. NPDC127103]|uniref:ATP-binding protein n=1 Tax=Streptomyces sp. NPDC127103 TaxID=3347139 RepID=UPI0036489723
MTTYPADQERPYRPTLASAGEEGQHADAPPAIDLCIERRPDPVSGGVSEQDAAWVPRLRRILWARLEHWHRPDLVSDAELLLTELLVNAFQHASGATVDVRVHHQGDRLRMVVDDHSSDGPLPRPAGLYEEHGRGLLLVDALADAWGVSEDRTQTWCTLPLPEGLPPVRSGPAPVWHESEIRIPGNSRGLTLAGIQGRISLTLLNWHGPQNRALQVLYVLVHNAVQHGIAPGRTGQAIAIWLRVTEAHELLIDVTDPAPEFPQFEAAIDGELGRGLPGAQRLGATLSWTPDLSTGGKTVRALMQPGQVDL